MAVTESLLDALFTVLSWPTILWLIIGLIIGIVAGALPGLGPATGMAILLPLTLPLEQKMALILLVSIYAGSMYGGSISAILMNAPGVPGSAATSFDGYPLSRQGRATDALAVSATSSAIGGLLSTILLIMLTPLLTTIVLLFGSPEYFLMALLGLSLITVVSRGSLVKGLMAGAFGLLISTIGVAPVRATPRFTFDIIELYDGLHFVAVLIGLFAVSEMFILAGTEGGIAGGVKATGSSLSGIKSVVQHWKTVLKSSLIGMAIGAIPGAGASIANFVSYGEAVRSAKDPEKFGQGAIRGVISAEASNNGTVAGSLIPTLSFGIPGSGATAVLLGGLLMHGLRPGPDLFTTQIDITYSLFISLFVSSIAIFLIGVAIITRADYLTRIDTHLLIPVIIVLAMLGGLALRNNWLDPFTLVFFGVLGYFMKKHDISIIALVLGVVLGPIAESNLLRSLQLSGGSYSIFVSKPLSAVLLFATLVVIFGPVIMSRVNRFRGNVND